VIRFLNGEQGIRQLIANLNQIYLSSIVLGELYFGAVRSNQVAENLARIEEFSRLVPVLLVDDEVARSYAQFRLGLKSIGRPIPENDAWIAAIAVRHGLTLITNDAHFSVIQSLRTVHW
jgi:tRNA(fMet)-specific endonuclease VapC